MRPTSKWSCPGRGPQTLLSSTPPSHDFGSRDVDDGATGEQFFTIANAGTEPVTLSALTLTGDASSFERLALDFGPDCRPGTVIAVSSSCTVRVRFDPPTTGAKAATLTIESDAADLEVELSGTGIQTLLSSTPASHDFGSRDVDDGPTVDAVLLRSPTPGPRT